MGNRIEINAAEDAWYLPQLFGNDDARRVAQDAFQRYADSTLGKDRSIAQELANYFKAAQD